MARGTFASIGGVKRISVVVLAIVISVGACVFAFPAAGNAASVHRWHLSSKTYKDDLVAVSRNADFTCYLTALSTSTGNATPSIQGPGGPGTISATYAASDLTGLIDTQGQLSYLANHHNPVTSSDLDQARTNLIGALNQTLQGSSCPTTSGLAVLDSLPPSFVDLLVTQQAVQTAVNTLAIREASKPGLAFAFYRFQPSLWDTVCFNLVYSQSPQAVSAAQQAIGGGQSIGQAVSASQGVVSSTPSPECVGPNTSLFSASYGVQRNTVGLPIGQPSQIVSAGGTYAFYIVTKRTPNTFAASRAAIINDLAGQASRVIDAKSGTYLSQDDVVVNSQFGRWQAPTRTVAGQVDPPLAPTH